jgi:hypothetical protein
MARLSRDNNRKLTISSVNFDVRMLGFELVLEARPKRPPRSRRSRAGVDDDDVQQDTPEDEGE